MADPGLLAKNLLKKHFPKFGTIRMQCVYYEMDNSEYDADIGAADKTIISMASVMIIFDNASPAALASVSKVDNEGAQRGTKIAIFPALDLPGVAPTNGDEIAEENSRRWQVIGIAPDPAYAHYSLVVKEIG